MLKAILILILSQCILCPSFAQKSSTRFSKDTAALAPAKRINYLNAKNIALATAFSTYGILRPDLKGIASIDKSTQHEILEDHPGFSTHVDDYLQWMPAISMGVLNAAHVNTAHNFKQQAIRQAASIVVMSVMLYPAKKLTREMRPDKSGHSSFPSGHTANAFRGAEILHEELKYTHPVWSYSGYVVATTTGALRVYNNRHWVSDVVAGAGLGILSTKLTYLIFERRSKRKK
jgi:membrane-associated phospholipid phosphatase